MKSTGMKAGAHRARAILERQALREAEMAIDAEGICETCGQKRCGREPHPVLFEILVALAGVSAVLGLWAMAEALSRM